MDTRLMLRVGPLVFSQRLGGGGRPELVAEGAQLPAVCDALRADGWKLSSPAAGVVYASKGWQSRRIEQVPGGLRASRATSDRVVAVWFAAGLLVLASCVGLVAL